MYVVGGERLSVNVDPRTISIVYPLSLCYSFCLFDFSFFQRLFLILFFPSLLSSNPFLKLKLRMCLNL